MMDEIPPQDARNSVIGALEDLHRVSSGRAWPVGATLRALGDRRRRRRRAVRVGGIVAVTTIAIVSLATLTTTSQNPRQTTENNRSHPIGGKTPGTESTVVKRSGGATELLSTASTTSPPHARGAASAAEQAFSLSLLRNLVSASPSTNHLVSPFSLAETLLMLELGAKGSTAAQIGSALGLSNVSSALQARDWSAMSADLQHAGNKTDQVALEDADSLWTQTGLDVMPGYLASLKQTFNAGLWQVDFTQSPDQTVRAINAWASLHTNGHIPQLVSPSDIDQKTVLALLNAVYFTGPWRIPLDNQPSGIFHAPDKNLTVPFLGSVTSQLAFLGNGVQEVQLSYGNDVTAAGQQGKHAATAGRYAADIIMPTSKTLAKWLRSVSETSWQSLIRHLKSRTIDLSFPSFSLTGGEQLNQSLETLGIKNAFSASRADFSGISAGARYVKLIKQVSTLDVSKWGTVASAATAAVGDEALVASSAPLRFNFDRPFLFMIRDTKTGAILFTAAVENPAG